MLSAFGRRWDQPNNANKGRPRIPIPRCFRRGEASWVSLSKPPNLGTLQQLSNAQKEILSSKWKVKGRSSKPASEIADPTRSTPSADLDPRTLVYVPQENKRKGASSNVNCWQLSLQHCFLGWISVKVRRFQLRTHNLLHSLNIIQNIHVSKLPLSNPLS